MINNLRKQFPAVAAAAPCRNSIAAPATQHCARIAAGLQRCSGQTVVTRDPGLSHLQSGARNQPGVVARARRSTGTQHPYTNSFKDIGVLLAYWFLSTFSLILIQIQAEI